MRSSQHSPDFQSGNDDQAGPIQDTPNYSVSRRFFELAAGWLIFSFILDVFGASGGLAEVGAKVWDFGEGMLRGIMPSPRRLWSGVVSILVGMTALVIFASRWLVVPLSYSEGWRQAFETLITLSFLILALGMVESRGDLGGHLCLIAAMISQRLGLWQLPRRVHPLKQPAPSGRFDLQQIMVTFSLGFALSRLFLTEPLPYGSRSFHLFPGSIGHTVAILQGDWSGATHPGAGVPGLLTFWAIVLWTAIAIVSLIKFRAIAHSRTLLWGVRILSVIFVIGFYHSREWRLIDGQQVGMLNPALFFMIGMLIPQRAWAAIGNAFGIHRHEKAEARE